MILLGNFRYFEKLVAEEKWSQPVFTDFLKATVSFSDLKSRVAYNFDHKDFKKREHVFVHFAAGVICRTPNAECRTPNAECRTPKFKHEDLRGLSVRYMIFSELFLLFRRRE